jgi:hypothetical protein
VPLYSALLRSGKSVFLRQRTERLRRTRPIATWPSRGPRPPRPSGRRRAQRSYALAWRA